MYTYLFHGPSGCGKDTQVDLLVKKYKAVKIETGDMFRKLLEAKDPDAIEAHKYWGQGHFSPSALTYKMFDKWIKNYDLNQDIILVSVVRNVDQIPMLDDLLSGLGRKLDGFIHLNLSEAAAIERLSLRSYCPNCGATYHDKYKPEKVAGICDVCGHKLEKREDDKPKLIVERLKEYNKTIEPILAEYAKRGILTEVDASPSIEVIHEQILKLLKFTRER